MIKALLQNWQTAFRETLESALAAGLAWWFGLLVFGDERAPLFAAVTAVVCLAPGLPSHSKQAFGLLVGVIAGIAVGEIVLAMAGGAHPAVLGGAVFLSMMAALTFKVQPIVGIQAGVSTVIVLVEGQEVDSYARVVDALIGGAVALTFSQVLLTPDPFVIMRRKGEVLVEAAHGLQQRLSECRDGDVERSDVEDAIREFHRSMMTLEEELEYVGRIADRTLRGRLHRERIRERVGQWRLFSRRTALALSDTSHGVLAPHERQDDEANLEEAARLIAAGRGLARDDDNEFNRIRRENDGANKA